MKTMHDVFAAVLNLVTIAILPAAAMAAPAAIVTDLRGASELRLMQEIDSGQDIALDAGTHAILFFPSDGAQYTVSGPGRFHVVAAGPRSTGAAPTPVREAAPPVFRGLKLRTAGVVQGGIVMRGDEHPSLVAPVDDVVPDLRPEFVWEPLTDQATYRFELADAQGRSIHAAEGPGTQLKLPTAIHLRAGETYYWSIEARDAELARQVKRAAKFRVADNATMRRLETARPPADAPFSHRVLYAMLLESAGARHAARQMRQALAAERELGPTRAIAPAGLVQ